MAAPSETSASVLDSSVTRLSLNTGNQIIGGDSRRPSYSGQAQSLGGTGDSWKQWIAFDTGSPNAVSTDSASVALTGFSADTNAKRDVVIRDRNLAAAPTRIVSVDLQSGQQPADSWNPAVNGNGRFVAFLSNGTFGDGTGEGNERPCDDPSPDESAAGQGNEARDLNGPLTDVYVRDRDADSKQNITGSVDVYDQRFLPGQVAGSLPYCGTKTALVSVGTDELQANKPNGYKSVQDGSLGISDDGRFVIFATTAQVVTTDSAGAVKSVDNDALLDVYVRDRDTDGDGKFDERDTASTYLLSQATANTVAAGFPTISADGRFIAYEDGSNIRIVRLSVVTGRPTVTTVGTLFAGSRPAIGVAAGATSGAIVYQRSGIVYSNAISIPVSGASSIGTERSIGAGTLPQLDRAGRTVAFSRSIVGGVQSVRAGSTSVGGSRLISRTAASVNGNDASGAQTVFPEIAVLDDAATNTAFVAFSSDASNLISGANNEDSNGVRDVFEQRWTQVVISVSTSGTPTVPAARGIRLTDVPATALTFDKALLARVVGAPAGAIRSLPSGGVRSLPSGGVRSLPGGGVRSLQLQGLPLGGIRSLPSGGLRSLPSGTVRSLDVALSQLALSVSVDGVSYTWAELLVGSPYTGWPLQSVTMRDLLDYIDVIKAQSATSRTVAQTVLLSLTLFDIDPQGTFLQGVSLVSIFLGDYTLAELSAAASPNTINWCATLPATLAAGVRTALCASTSTLFALDLGGADLSQINLDLIDASRLTPAKVGGALEALVQTYGPIAAGTGLGTYIMTFLDARDFPWENVALLLPGALNTTYPGSGGANLEPHARGGLATWVSNVNTPEIAPVVVKFTLPAGFVYAPGTAGCGGSCAPTVTTSTSGGVSQVTVAFTSAVGANPVTVGARPTPLLLGPTNSAASLATINDQPVGGAARVEVTYDGDVTYDSNTVPNAVAPVTVFDPWSSGQRALEPGTLYFADIAGASEEDEYTIALPAGMPAGTKLSVRLSGLSSDLDLTVFVTDPSAPTSLPGGAIRSLPNGAVRSLPGGGVRSLPAGAIRSLNGYVRSLPLEDVGDDRTSSLPPEVLQDIPQGFPQSLPGGYVRSLSPNRDNRPEIIDTVVGTGTGSSPLLYTVRVTGYNDSTGPYALRVITDPPANPSPAQCNVIGDAANLSISTLPADATTLILYPKAAIAAKYSAADAAALNAKVSELAAFEASQGRPTSIVEVTYNAGFDWTTDDPCSPVRANAVATSISDELIELGLPSGATVPPLQYVVIIGGDDVLPMARVADTTEVSNEADYANSFGRSNPLARSAAAGRVLTDNIYGDLNPGTIGDTALLVPELAVGRLVETPVQIGAQIDAFVQSRGVLDASTKSVAAYDFLLDSGAAIASNLGDTDTSLTNNTWNSQALLAALGANPKVISLNAHFDHQGLLTAAGNDGQGLDGFPDQIGLNSIQSLNTAVVFSVGCHSGLNVPQTYNTGGGLRFRDWADELSTKSALFVANTGFGYGDTEAIALSEQLMTSFSGLIGTYTAGQALVAAKQDYAASLGSYVGYDEKVVHQSTMYGLPMYSLDLGGAASTQSALLPSSSQTQAQAPASAQAQGNPDVVDATTTAGSANALLQTASVVVTSGGTDAKGYPISPAVASPVANGLIPDRQVSNGYPIVPRLQVDVTADGDLMARGALITSLTATQPQSSAALYARATVDLTSREASNIADDVYFPTVFQTVNHVGGPGGGKDRLVLLPGQYRKGASDSTGTMTSFTSMQASVFYGQAGTGDLTPPTIDSVVADKVVPPAGVTGDKAVVFRVTTSDQQSGVWRVVVLYDLGGDWVPIELTQLGGVPNEWVGSLQTNEVDGPRFIVQVVNNDGRVGTATDKGRFYKVTGTRPTLVTVIRGQLGNNGWYVQGPTGAGSAVLAEIYGAPGATFVSTVTRSGSAAVGPVPYAGPVELKDTANIKDGLFSVLAQSTGGATLVTNVKVDAAPPTISATVDGVALSTNINLPTEVIAFAPGLVAFSCSDATSGVANSAITVFPGTIGTDSCSGDGTLNTGAPKGLRTVTATATDVAGNVVTTTFYATITDTGLPVVTITPTSLSGNEATEGAGALVLVAVTVTGTDAIDGPLTVVCTKPDGTVVTPGSTQLFALGVTVVTCTATDSSGNTGSGTFTVTVGDTIAPVVGVPGPVTAEASSAAGAPVTFTATASDAVTPNLVPTCSAASGSTFAIGTTTVTCSATDGSGNTGTASFLVNVVDTVKPELKLNPAGNIVQEATGPNGALVTYTVTASDTVSGVLTPSCNPLSGSTFPLGTTTVTCSATDRAGNTNSITFDVTVVDHTAPTLNMPVVPVVEAAGAGGSIVDYTVTASDTVDPTVMVSCTPASGGTFAVGTTTVNCTATDDANNQATGSFTVSVFDRIAPSLTVPSAITAEASSASGAVVTFATSATDAVTAAPTVACVPPSGSTFALGSTTVRCTASDAAGNTSAQKTFTVIVSDTIAPVLTVPSNITIGATSGAGTVVTFVASATDAVTAAPTVTCVPTSGSTFPIGTTTVTCTARDAANNTSAPKSFTVTVIKPYRYSGFYSPVNMDEVSKPLGADGVGTVVNSVNGGRNVPLKFEVFENGVEITDIRRIEVVHTKIGGANVAGCAGKTVIPLSSSTSKAVLKFDGSQMIEGWATPKVPAGQLSQCWKVTVRVMSPTPGDSTPGITGFFLVTP